MTDRIELKPLRRIAKRLARSTRVPLSQALDIIATQCGHPHWNALTSEWDKGWRPDAQLLADFGEVETAGTSPRGVFATEVAEGQIGEEPYELQIGFDDVLMGGLGWAIYLGHAPSEKPRIERYGRPNPLDDDAFFSEVMKIANAAADKVREAISRDWPRRSTKPDADGKAVHPLFKGGASAEWYCLHCDAKSSAAQMAANMWHCPHCSAAPIDIHPFAWWKDEAA